MNPGISQLSSQAFDELNEIIRQELGDSMSDDEIEAMGVRLLKLFSILMQKEGNGNKKSKPIPIMGNKTVLVSSSAE